MAATVVGTINANYAIAADETGVNLESIETDFQNPRAELQDRTGQTKAFAVNYDPRLIISIKGEISGNTGHAAATFVAATTIANTIAGHGITAGGAYLTTCKESQSRTGWKTLDATYTACPGIS